MVAVFSENLRITNAKSFKDTIERQVANSRVYFTYGRIQPWANDAAPDQANSSVIMFNDVWNNMIGAKLLVGSEVSHAIPRNNWTANTKYDMYDACECSLLLYNQNTKFFIVTPDWNVYKCLSNASSSGNSTVMPTQTFTDRAIEESDGYVWKYMYTISEAEIIKYTTENYIPVKTLEYDDGSLQWDVQQAAIEGAIEAVKVTNGGSNYSNASNIVITITGDGTGATANARINAISKTVSNISMISIGSGYTYATISITGGGGTGATARAMIAPPGGHGNDPLYELGGGNLILNPRLQYDETGKFPTTNEFRQIALIYNPVEKSTGRKAANAVYGQTVTAIFEPGTTNFVQDEIVYQGPTLELATFTGRVASWDATNNSIALTNTQGSLTTDILLGTTSGATRVVLSGSINDKQLRPYSGELLYIDNIKPITRAPDQVEDFKLLLRF